MNNSFSCVIVDDEQDAIDLLLHRLHLLYKNVHVTGTYTFWEEALDALRAQDPDIIFMDISMPGKNGMDLLRLLPGISGEIIFITAHEEYALHAFEFVASGYILKPVDDVELAHAVDRAVERTKNKKIAQHITDAPVRIGIPDTSGINYVNLSDIHYFESVNGYTRVVTKTATILSSFSIGKFRNVLDSKLFYQVHRSYIVNISSVCRYRASGEIVMQDNKEIPVSRNTREEFLNLFSTITRRYQ